ncbi:MAG TPA: IS1595 family transposase [Pyrinomonadaceae bacterium]|nr:IS1595 family transposase [Pyrinomonadaceae bacterium]
MEQDANFTKTLQEAIKFFSDLDTCVTFMAQIRWPEGVTCPYCAGKAVSYLSTRRIWKCMNKACHKQFSVKVGTIMEDSPIGLDKWLAAVWLITNAKNGISSCEVARSLGVTQKSAWFLLHRIRLAMQTGTFEKLSGEVEVDETYIGGKARFMHKEKREAMIKGRGSVGKVAVMGLLERNGKVRAKVIGSTTRETLHAEVKEHVEPGTSLFTDELRSYRGLQAEYIHNVINHAEKYVDGNVHTCNIDNFWSLLKRGIKGTYVSVEPFHLFRYLDEQSFRFNMRKGKDADRFVEIMKSVAGKRLTFDELIGSKKPPSH